MSKPRQFLRLFSRSALQDALRTPLRARRPQFPCLRQPLLHRTYRQPADDPNFLSILDKPAVLVRVNRKHGPGLIILALIPLTAFVLGTWQIQRLYWKTDLIARFEDRLIRDPLPLPFRVDPDAIHEFDYRRVYATGRFRHDEEMLIGPRMHDGENGFMVVTPLERVDERGEKTKVLVCRGWISKEKEKQWTRKGGLPEGEVTVSGLLREPWKKNMFTPDNRPEKGGWYFPDVKQMAEWVGAQPVWIEETMQPDLLVAMDREKRGVPIGRPAEVNLRNNHTQYIFTWYALSLFTSVMFWMVVKKPPSGVQRRIKQSTEWT